MVLTFSLVLAVDSVVRAVLRSVLLDGNTQVLR
jgi:hypothetical protein